MKYLGSIPRAARTSKLRYAAVLIVVVLGCRTDESRVGDQPKAFQVRELWSKSFQKEPEIADFDDMVLLEDKLLVVESKTATIAALAIADGSKVWTAGKRGAGPGEYLEPRYFVARPDGKVGVVDIRQGRITVLDAAGSVAEMITGERVIGDLNNACSRKDGSIIAIKMPLFDVVKIDDRPASTLLFRLLWPVSIYNQTPMLQQGLFARSREGRCVIFQPRGDFFFELDGERLPNGDFNRYFTPYPPQRIDRSGKVPRAIPGGGAAQYAAMRGDTIFVLRGGPAKKDLGIVDAYVLPGGERVSSFTLPRETYVFDVVGDRVAALVSTEDGSILSVFSR